MTMAVPPRLARVLYRSFLRASQKGERPEVFGRHGAAAFQAQVKQESELPSLALPSSAAQVRHRLKACFRSPTGNNNSPLEVLGAVSQQEGLLLSSTNSCTPKKELPIFDYSGVAALPGETTQFVFVEPRYLHLAAQMLQEESDGQFLLRSSPGSSRATVVKLISHLPLPNHTSSMVAVACLGGPRVTIHDTTMQHVEGEMDKALAEKYNIDLVKSKQLAWATHYEWQTDCAPSGDKFDRDLSRSRQYILDMLSLALPLQDSSLVTTLSQFGLPPLDVEAFSFWALRYVLAPDDVASRFQWLETSHTAGRLEFVARELEDILEQQSEYVGQKQKEEKYAQEKEEEEEEEYEEEEEELVASFA